ncbi:MAG: hypothetical protein ACLVJV_04245 [Oscillospiraceae bacterium]
MPQQDVSGAVQEGTAKQNVVSSCSWMTTSGICVSVRRISGFALYFRSYP